MTLQQMRYAIEIDKNGSINQTALSLYITRQALTSAINKLEKELGFKIFERTNKGLQTTNKGFEFLKMAKTLTTMYENFQRIFSTKDRNGIRFDLVSIPNYFVERAFVKLCASSEPGSIISATIRETDPMKALDAVYSSRAELATVYIGEMHKSSWVNMLSSRGLEYFPLLSTQASVLLSAKDPLAKNSVISPHQLEGYSFVFWADSTMNILGLFPETSEFAKIIIKNNRFITAQYQSTLFLIVEKTKAFALNFSGMNEQFSIYPIVNVPLDEKNQFELVCVKRKNCTLSREAASFIQILQESINERQKKM